MEPVNSAVAYNNITLPALSLEVLWVFLALVLPTAAVLGFLTGARRRARLIAAGREVDKVVGETTIGAILALLGLLLAFTFGNALSLSQIRKGAMVDEAAALGTVFLRADFLAEPHRTELQTAILAYTKTRLAPGDGSIDSVAEAQAFLAASLEAQSVLWPMVLEATTDPVPPAIKTFIAGAMNEALDAHLYRMQTLSVPIVEFTHPMLLAAALAGLFLLGNRAGMVGRKLTWRTFMFSGFLFVVMCTIVDTQRGSEGFITMDESTLRATLVDMEQALASRL